MYNSKTILEQSCSERKVDFELAKNLKKAIRDEKVNLYQFIKKKLKKNAMCYFLKKKIRLIVRKIRY